MKIVDRKERIKDAIIWDLVKLNMLTCKPISQQQDTRQFAARTTRPLRIASAQTRPMATEVDR